MRIEKLFAVDLFAGARSFGKAAEDLGMEVFSTDIKNYPGMDFVIDILDLRREHIPRIPRFIWASPDCTSYSIAAVSHHRRYVDGWPEPTSAKAVLGDKLALKMLEVFSWFPDAFWAFENPQGMLHKMKFMQPEFSPVLRDSVRHVVTYCQYGDTRMKPTVITTNSLKWKPRARCYNGNPCHEAAPRGSRTGTQGRKNAHERSKIPHELCLEIIRSCI